MSALTKKIGEIDMNTNVEIYGLRLFNAYKKKHYYPFVEDNTYGYIEEYNIKLL